MTATVLQALELLVISIGVFGGLIQLRELRRGRQREAALELLRSFNSPAFAQGLSALFTLPDNLSLAEFKEKAGIEYGNILTIAATMESLGVLVHRNEIDIEMAADFFSAPSILLWRKFGRSMVEMRDINNRDTIGEWCQWLAEQMEKLEQSEPAAPAHIAYRDWTPASRKAST